MSKTTPKLVAQKFDDLATAQAEGFFEWVKNTRLDGPVAVIWKEVENGGTTGLPGCLETTADNAALIVCAVNAHDDLVRYATLERSYSKLCDRRAPDYSHERLMVWLEANGCDVKNGEPVGAWLARERDAALAKATPTPAGEVRE